MRKSWIKVNEGPLTVTSIRLEQYAQVAFAPRRGESIVAYKTGSVDGLGNNRSPYVWVS